MPPIPTTHDAHAEGRVETVVEELFESVNVVREYRHEFARLFVGEEPHVEPLHLVVRVRPYRVLYLLRERVEAPVAEPVKPRGDDERHDEDRDDEPELRCWVFRSPAVGEEPDGELRLVQEDGVYRKTEEERRHEVK